MKIELDPFLNKTLEFFKGVGTAKADLLISELNIRTVGDILMHFPFRYVDRSQYFTISQLKNLDDYGQVMGVLGPLREEGTGPKKRLKGSFTDKTGTIELIWFKGIRWMKENLKPGNEYVLYGKVTSFNSILNVVHPELEFIKDRTIPQGYLQPIYNTTEKLTKRGLSSKGIERIIEEILSRPELDIEETLPEYLREQLVLVPRRKAIHDIHRPKTQKDILQARRTLKFDELFYIQLELLLRKELRTKQVMGYVFENVGNFFNTFYENHLPFELTNAQKRVMRELRRDMKSGTQMNRLLQGDVGSGKTIVAALAALIAIDNGFQACIMAPTEILAGQHYETIAKLLNPLGIKIDLLTGSVKTKKRRIIDENLQSGELHILIGTHALLEDKVIFKNLGLAIIDEQHRFGVAQRAKLWKKNKKPPHVLVMTATPIPRTLSMTLYGDLDVSVIDELPPGRKEVKTLHLRDNARLRIFGFMEEQIKLGRQVYVVYPLIEESQTLDLKDLQDGYESIARRFPIPDYQISIVHGKMKPADKDFEMERFAKGETQIMVATTVIEVGVNVPNATVMVIESAQRFGLSQLHQLRGRVGRGGDQSFCILVSDMKLSSEARLRMKTMVETTDGFKIAEVDLNLRGPGDLMGTQQSGIVDLKLANLTTDVKILQYARNTAMDILEEDPELTLEKNRIIRNTAIRIFKSKPNWSLIS